MWLEFDQSFGSLYDMLYSFSIGDEILCGVREWQVAYIVAESSHPQNTPIVRKGIRVPQIWKKLSDLIR
jgi:hypothetical protein